MKTIGIIGGFICILGGLNSLISGFIGHVPTAQHGPPFISRFLYYTLGFYFIGKDFLRQAFP
jgi:hypothetical protein